MFEYGPTQPIAQYIQVNSELSPEEWSIDGVDGFIETKFNTM